MFQEPSLWKVPGNQKVVENSRLREVFLERAGSALRAFPRVSRLRPVLGTYPFRHPLNDHPVCSSELHSLNFCFGILCRMLAFLIAPFSYCNARTGRPGKTRTRHGWRVRVGCMPFHQTLPEQLEKLTSGTHDKTKI